MNEKQLEKVDNEARDIYNFAAGKISAYLKKEYEDTPGNTLHDQIAEFHLIAERTCVYIMGNVLSMLNTEAAEEAILTLNKHIRSMAQALRHMTPEPNGRLN